MLYDYSEPKFNGVNFETDLLICKSFGTMFFKEIIDLRIFLQLSFITF